jgi:hypothetical protein
MPSGFPGLVEYYGEFVSENFKQRNGKPVSKRSAQLYAQKYNFPLVRIGNNTFIDPELATARLREALLLEPALFAPPRRRGRPKLTRAAVAAPSPK